MREGRLKKRPRETIEENPDDTDDERIVSLKVLGRELWCKLCKQVLTLDNVEREKHQGFGSTLTVRCQKCLLLNTVVTGRQRSSPDKKQATHFERNFKAVLGCMHSGIGWTQLNKFCSIMNIPCPDKTTFERYEREIKLAAEEVAKSACHEAAAKERELTVIHAEAIEK